MYAISEAGKTINSGTTKRADEVGNKRRFPGTRTDRSKPRITAGVRLRQLV